MPQFSDPTTPNESQIGTGGDYTTIELWEDGTDNDLVTATAGEIGQVLQEELTSTGSLLIAGATTNTSYFRILRPLRAGDTDGSDAGIVENGPIALAYNSSYAARQTSTGAHTLLDMAESSAKVEGLQFKGNNFNNKIALSSNNPKVANCIFQSNSTNNTANTILADGATINNTVLYQNSSETHGWNLNNATKLYHCTVYSPDTNSNGFNENSGTGNVVKNCWSVFQANAFGGGTFDSASDYNAGGPATDTTAPGASSVDDIELADITVNGVSDFSPAEGGDLEGAGEIVSGFEDDFWGTSRGTAGNACDIGPAEVIAAGGGPTARPQTLLTMGVG